MELKHFSHTHPLIFNEEWRHESDDHKVCCSGCGELLSGPSFNCVACGFYLHKQCAEAPVEMNHPFHRNHSFTLLQKKPYSGRCWCNFCGKTCEHFVYHCSRKLHLHIKCALFTYNFVEKRMGELQHIARIEPLISTEKHDEELQKAKCFACRNPLLDSVYLSPECGFFLHAKCVDLSAEIKHPLHPQHQLSLQFNPGHLYCKICNETKWIGFSYFCSPCKFLLHIDCAAMPTKVDPLYHRQHSLSLQLVNEPFPCLICQETKHIKAVYFCSICKVVLHIDCVSPPLMIEDKTHHDHPFVLFHRQVSFNCDACGTSGNYVPYFCSACGLIVHRKCISLPHILKHPMHPEHPISHTYFLKKDKVDSWECRICHIEDVNPEHGSYYCSKCNYIVHVNCAIEYYKWYAIVEEDTEEDLPLLSYSVVKEIKDENVVAIEIKHFSHQHNLHLSNDVRDDICCDACAQFIFTSYYYCSSQCNFFLHKYCAELPRKKHIWFHRHTSLHSLSSDGIFRCARCFYENSGFRYSCEKCSLTICIRCAVVSVVPRCEGHEHPLPYYPKFEGTCNACGDSTRNPYRCKRCNFNLHLECLKLPPAVQHKSDTHLLKLTYGDNNVYSEYNYCDICEKERNPKHWFYHCAICDNSAHVGCVYNKKSFIKLGSIYTTERHQHPLPFVQKVHFYPDCDKCGKPCLDLALECKEIGCNFIIHWKCIEF